MLFAFRMSLGTVVFLSVAKGLKSKRGCDGAAVIGCVSVFFDLTDLVFSKA